MRRPKITASTMCGRCGVRIRSSFVFSRHTGAFYCSDEKGCERRARRKKEK